MFRFDDIMSIMKFLIPHVLCEIEILAKFLSEDRFKCSNLLCSTKLYDNWTIYPFEPELTSFDGIIRIVIM